MDQLVRVIAKDAPVKAVAISAAGVVERARAIHDAWPVAAAALGRLLMAASMMGSALKKENGAVTLRIKGGGPLGALTAVSDSGGNVRGYVQQIRLLLVPQRAIKRNRGSISKEMEPPWGSSKGLSRPSTRARAIIRAPSQSIRIFCCDICRSS